MKTCECGCGAELFPYRGKYPRFRSGHHAKLMSRLGIPQRTKYVPRPDEIPSGLCECGCGKRTTLARRTDRKGRRFQGHPLPFLVGHGKNKGQKTKGENHPNWKGGRSMHNEGYMMIRMPDHPKARSDGYVLEHRYVMEQHLGRHLTSEETVHHRNGDRLDNRIENLELWTQSHKPGQRVSDLLAWAYEIIDRYGPEQDKLAA